MRRVFVVPEYDDSLERLCAALRVIQNHRGEPPVLEPSSALSELASADHDTAIALLTPPPADAPRELAAFRAQLEDLSERAPDLPLLVISSPPRTRRSDEPAVDARWVRTLGSARVDEILLSGDEELPSALARRIEAGCRSRFTIDFLDAFGTQISDSQWLVLGRFLEGLRGGVVLSTPELAAACHRDPVAVCATFEPGSWGSIEDWRIRGLVYAVFRRAEDEGSTLHEAARHFGLDGHSKLDDACLAVAGLAAQEVEVRGGWRSLLVILLAKKGNGLDEASTEPPEAEGSSDSQAECGRGTPPGCAALVDRMWDTVYRAARSTLASDEDAEVQR